MNEIRLRVMIAIVVTLIWAAAFVDAMATKNYTGATLVTPLMALIVGALYSSTWMKSRNSNNHGKGTS